MIQTTGNPDLDFLFEEDSFRTKKKTPQEIELSKLYESTFVEMPQVGQIITATFTSETKDCLVFSKTGYKDDIRVDNKLSESKYLKNSQFGEFIDVLIIDINHDNFYIKGSISTLYENRAHQTLKSLKEGESVLAHIR